MKTLKNVTGLLLFYFSSSFDINVTKNRSLSVIRSVCVHTIFHNPKFYTIIIIIIIIIIHSLEFFTSAPADSFSLEFEW